MIYLDFDGKWLGRFRAWIERLPDKTFQEATIPEKIGRILMIVAVLAMFFAPLWWWMRA